ncbi:MAG: hypothetical protein NTX76_04115 [Alphaproteobacteria bacterium]|nr:hypothetical protein [Alphaproteobacteria bacterium]
MRKFLPLILVSTVGLSASSLIDMAMAASHLPVTGDSENGKKRRARLRALARASTSAVLQNQGVSDQSDPVPQQSSISSHHDTLSGPESLSGYKGPNAVGLVLKPGHHSAFFKNILANPGLSMALLPFMSLLASPVLEAATLPSSDVTDPAASSSSSLQQMMPLSLPAAILTSVVLEEESKSAAVISDVDVKQKEELVQKSLDQLVTETLGASYQSIEAPRQLSATSFGLSKEISIKPHSKVFDGELNPIFSLVMDKFYEPFINDELQAASENRAKYPEDKWIQLLGDAQKEWRRKSEDKIITVIDAFHLKIQAKDKEKESLISEQSKHSVDGLGSLLNQQIETVETSAAFYKALLQNAVIDMKISYDFIHYNRSTVLEATRSLSGIFPQPDEKNKAILDQYKNTQVNLSKKIETLKSQMRWAEGIMHAIYPYHRQDRSILGITSKLGLIYNASQVARFKVSSQYYLENGFPITEDMSKEDYSAEFVKFLKGILSSGDNSPLLKAAKEGGRIVEVVQPSPDNVVASAVTSVTATVDLPQSIELNTIAATSAT